MSDQPGPITLVTDYFKSLQASICETLSGIDGSAQFSVEDIETPGGGHSRPRVIDGGEVLERGAVQFTHSIGARCPLQQARGILISPVKGFRRPPFQ